MEILLHLDHKILFLINHTLTCAFLDSFFVNLTDFAKSPLFYGLLVFILAGVFKKYGWRGMGVLVLAVAFSSLLDAASSMFLKSWIARPRPEFTGLSFDVILRRPSEGSFSFPSSHALDAFFIASYIGVFARRWGWMLLGFAGLIAYSRVYVGLHFPFDVLVGAALGAYLGFVSAKLVQWIFEARHE
jgi:undecaprenyl-diphosphatase